MAYYFVGASDRGATRFVELGVVVVLVQALVDAGKGTSEKALMITLEIEVE